MLLLRIYYEDRIRNTLHFLDTAQVLLQTIPFLLQVDDFLLRKNIESTVLRHTLDLFESLDTGLDGLEVGEHTTKPSLIYIVHTATLCFALDRFLSLLLCTNEKYGTALCCDIRDRIVSVVHHTYGLLQVDDVDTVTFCEDVRCHLRVPASGLMSEMNTGFQQLLHRNYAHFDLPPSGFDFRTDKQGFSCHRNGSVRADFLQR